MRRATRTSPTEQPVLLSLPTERLMSFTRRAKEARHFHCLARRAMISKMLTSVSYERTTVAQTGRLWAQLAYRYTERPPFKPSLLIGLAIRLRGKLDALEAVTRGSQSTREAANSLLH